jgi:TonB family protein
MSSELMLNNLLLWSIQMVALLAIATLFPALARLTTPSARLAYWQFALLTCLALPVLRPWQQLVAVAETPSVNAGVRLALTPHAAHSYALPATSDLIVWALVLGVAIRLGLICAGFFRLAKYRRHSVPLEPATPWAVEAELLVSDAVGSPVTFGFLRPVVLLPPDFANLPEAARDAVLCHEILHVRRKDWLFTLAEELVRAVFWFHPGIWWTLGEIQLAREQTVDRAVVDMMKSRDAYVDALLTIAGASASLDVAPAPLFLRKRHLKQRVVSILKEARMSPKRTFSMLAAGIALLSASCWFVSAALPLQGAPQSVVDGEGVSVQMNGAQLMHRAPVSYPRDAMVKGVEGNVVAQVKTDGAGNVIDASILSGPDELRKSVLQSLLGWHFAKDSAQTTRQVVIGFVLPKDAAVRPVVSAPATGVMANRAVRVGDFSVPMVTTAAPQLTIKSINVVGLSEDVKNELLKSLPVHEGDVIPQQSFANIARAVHEVDEHLTTGLSGPSSETTLTIRAPEAPLATAAAIPAAQPGQIRVGGAVQAYNLLNQVRPEYPPLAKQARVQGTVTFRATIAKDGTIANLNLISGPPLLVQAAQQAVSQWQYKPTLLNGQPVEVVTTIDVNFTLSQ